MEPNTPTSNEIPTALPGFENDDAREKLLLEAPAENSKDEADEEDIVSGNEAVRPKTRRWQVVRTLAAFAVFVCILAVGILWFFGMGWFSEQKSQPISRNASKDEQTSPATEDEKLKMALSMVATKDPEPSRALENAPSFENDISSPDKLASPTDIVLAHSGADADRNSATPVNDGQQYSLRVADQGSVGRDVSTDSKTMAVSPGTPQNSPAGETDVSEKMRGRSLFFGVSKRSVQTEESRKFPEPAAVDKVALPGVTSVRRIPFGTLLPVRLVGSIYTFRNSGGFVRMELTRPVDGKGYAYPAGTTVVGNVRGGESVRAFVTIIGLIDPATGELVRFGGELLGRDGGSGIEGRRRKLTSQWSRFFSGLKETAASILGSVGGIRSGGTVILSEPIRRGSETMAEDISDGILRNGKEDTFIEVAAGASGYVLVTGLPENSSVNAGELRPEALSK